MEIIFGKHFYMENNEKQSLLLSYCELGLKANYLIILKYAQNPMSEFRYNATTSQPHESRDNIFSLFMNVN